MHRSAITAAAPAGLAILLVVAGSLIAGPTAPPPGPVGSTYKTLAEVQPRTPVQSLSGSADSLYVITQPGSYYLTGNITGVAGKNGIEIDCPGVTLDLAGFRLAGVAQAGSGIFTPQTSFIDDVAVRDGTVWGWGQSGVFINYATNARVENVRASSNGVSGIVVGPFATLSGCGALGNSQYGIHCADRAAITNCSACANTLDGFHIGVSCTLLGCTADSNLGDGVLAGYASTLTSCTANSNQASGFHIFDFATLTSSTAVGNAAAGVFAGSGCTITGCNASSNTAQGIRADGNGNAVAGCTARLNGTDGVVVANRSSVLNSTCEANGAASSTGAGVRAAGSDNRIEGNTLTGNDIGVAVVGVRNVAVRNTASVNGIRDITPPGNAMAQWIFNPPTYFTNTDPSANIAF